MLRFAAANLADLAGVAHVFFGRKGGVSTGIYDSLNCGPGSRDDRDNVIENRRRALEAFAPPESRLATLYQIHGARAVTVREPWQIGEQPKADAMATAASDVALGILTADCAPILLADPEARIVGAAHAGWKGALAGVVESAIGMMEKLGARRERIAAAIGPCISQPAYEVGAELRAQVLADISRDECFFAPSDQSEHWRFDLPAYAHSRLELAGVHNISDLSICTYARESVFYSFRRATHRGESDYGRQLSAIMLV
ncbi:MAG: peptidoglycan editing factor PgeF [Rhizomicrobium sp.]